MNRRFLAMLSVAAVVALARDVQAQPKPSCAAGKTGKPAAITAKEAWDLAAPRARAWQADAVLFDLTTTSSGPLDSSGRSTDWDVKFSSASAKAVDMIGISDGQIRCFAIAGEGGQPIRFDDKILLDTKALYETAQKAGGSAVGPGAKVTAGLVPERRKDGTESWYLNYEDAGGREVLSVVIDARTGAVRNVFHTGK
ncbi:MAG TPA: hypothetical protein VGH97_12770 [Thermoanaerobaculia bacterium]|jgi:hypothetical protein